MRQATLFTGVKTGKPMPDDRQPTLPFTASTRLPGRGDIDARWLSQVIAGCRQANLADLQAAWDANLSPADAVQMLTNRH